MSKHTASVAAPTKGEYNASIAADTQFTNGVCQQLFVGGAGDVYCIDSAGNEVARFIGVLAGQYVNIQCAGLGTSTSATDITALFNN